MTHDRFAQALGYADWAALMQTSEPVISEGDISWYVTHLPDGHWATWDEAELSPDRVMRFASRGEAVAFHLGGYAALCRVAR